MGLKKGKVPDVFNKFSYFYHINVILAFQIQ